MDIRREEIENYISDKKMEEAFEELMKLELEDTDIENLTWRAEQFLLLQKFAYALNDFNKILKVDPERKIISAKIEMIKNIIKFQSLDIYGATNLNIDPWLDD